MESWEYRCASSIYLVLRICERDGKKEGDSQDQPERRDVSLENTKCRERERGQRMIFTIEETNKRKNSNLSILDAFLNKNIMGEHRLLRMLLPATSRP